MLPGLLGTDPWFEPKKYGYGSGLPIVWQGWVLLLGYVLVSTGFALLIERGHVWAGILGLVGTLIPFLWLVKRHTRGGWRWRSGS